MLKNDIALFPLSSVIAFVIVDLLHIMVDSTLHVTLVHLLVMLFPESYHQKNPTTAE